MSIISERVWDGSKWVERKPGQRVNPFRQTMDLRTGDGMAVDDLVLRPGDEGKIEFLSDAPGSKSMFDYLREKYGDAVASAATSRPTARLPSAEYDANGIHVSRDEGEAPDLDGAIAAPPPRKPLVAQSTPATVSGDDNDERGILSELSQGIDVDERAALNDPRARAEAQDARNRSDRMSNIMLQAAGLQPLTKQDDPYVSERDKMRDWLMKRAGVAQRGETAGLSAERTKAYLDSIQVARERDLAAQKLRAEQEGRKADAEKFTQDLKLAQEERAKNEEKRRQEAHEKKMAPKPVKPPPAPGGNFKGANELRKEFNSLPEVRSYKETVTSFEKIRRAAESPSAAGDMSLIFAFMKVLDPGSTVREGEFAAAQAAAGGDQRLLSALEQVRSGQRLTDAQRRDFVSQAEKLFASQRVNYDKARSLYRGLAERQSASPDDVTGPDEGGASAAPARSSDAVTVRRKSDGVTKVLSKAQAAKVLADPNYEEVK